MTPTGEGGPDATGWMSALAEAIEGTSPVDFVGVGNELRGDDAAGIEIITRLRSRLKGRRTRARVHPVAPMPERLLSRLASTADKIVIFDAVESAGAPGRILSCRLGESKYGFFATHNVPLTLVPGLASRRDEVILVGVQPKSLGVGEGLSSEVDDAVNQIVEKVAGCMEA